MAPTPTKKGKHKMESNHKDAAAQCSDPRRAEITRLLHDALDRRRARIVLSYQAGIVVRRSITRLVVLAGIRRRKSWADSFNRAVDELAQPGIARSRTREAELVSATLLRWLQAAAQGLADPPPPPKPAPAPRRRHAKPRRGFRRIPINTTSLVDFGIELKDTAVVALGCELRPGELGYLRVRTQFTEDSYLTLAFVCEPDRLCLEWARKSGAGVCIRHDPRRCGGLHRDDTMTLGRVVAVERQGQSVEPTLALRPCDEREHAEALARGFAAPTRVTPPVHDLEHEADEWPDFIDA
jgi:hypothetical protein